MNANSSSTGNSSNHQTPGDQPPKVPNSSNTRVAAVQTASNHAGHLKTHGETGLPYASQEALDKRLRDYESQFTLTTERMLTIVDAFVETLKRGLETPGQVVPMIPTFVFGWPKGDEVGDYLAIDLGGTNLRVCLVTLSGKGNFKLTQKKYRLTEEQKQEEGSKLFDFCASCLASFIETHTKSGLLKQGLHLPMGFTFSYPCHQERIDHGVLIRWTKGFGNPNTEGRDVAAMFSESLAKHGVPIKLTALINDTTGSLIASAYANPRTKIGVIFGTGCNAAYMEKTENIPKLKHLGIPAGNLMAINCEWGAFDSFQHQYIPRTRFDKIVDEASNKPGEQAFEKCISGRYLGEIFRLVLVELVADGVLFVGQDASKLQEPDSLDTAHLSLMEGDSTDELLAVIGCFIYLYNLRTTLEERRFFRSLGQLIATRAARLAACGISAIVRKCGYLEEGGCSVGADGSLYDRYPDFPNRVHQGIIDILGEKGKLIVTHHAEDGSGVGSAIIAAMTKQRKDSGLMADL